MKVPAVVTNMAIGFLAGLAAHYGVARWRPDR